MKCKNCGHILKKNQKKCLLCHNINDNISPKENDNNNQELKYLIENGNIYLIIFFSCITLSGLTFRFIPGINAFFNIISLLIIIIGYIKHPDNKTMKIIFWIYMFLIIILMGLFIYIINKNIN